MTETAIQIIYKLTVYLIQLHISTSLIIAKLQHSTTLVLLFFTFNLVFFSCTSDQIFLTMNSSGLSTARDASYANSSWNCNIYMLQITNLSSLFFRHIIYLSYNSGHIHIEKPWVHHFFLPQPNVFTKQLFQFQL